MIILITGAPRAGKTLLAQRLLEKFLFPYLSIDHLKMGLIRSLNTNLSPLDDDALTKYLWPIVREMIKTAIENKQNLIVEGCYIPFDWRKDFDARYLSSIKFICLSMTKNFIKNHFDEILSHSNDIESRFVDEKISATDLIAENEKILQGFRSTKENVTLIDGDYEKTVAEIFE